ncbi:MAG TPA: FAD binding domain-containing protein, partial [Aggregatilineales bacterium]|nr:FAD binding domain-containing protein [Aggregatilineales bacterium]
MPLRPKNYYRPTNLDEALEYLNQPDSAPLGGGTRLLAGDIRASTIVDLQDVGLSGIEIADGILRIGAATTLTDIIESDVMSGDTAGVLREALHNAGPNTFRNAATIGGVIGSRESNELLALLLALNADLMMPNHTLSLADYLVPDERPTGLIIAVEIPFRRG